MFDRPEVEVPRGMEPTGTNGRWRHHLPSLWWLGVGSAAWFFRLVALSTMGVCHEAVVGIAFCSRPLSGSRTVHGPSAGTGPLFFLCGGWSRVVVFAAVMAQVRRPVPFRTRKLRPGAAMVLHSEGCGRVARRRILFFCVKGNSLRDSPFRISG